MCISVDNIIMLTFINVLRCSFHGRLFLCACVYLNRTFLIFLDVSWWHCLTSCFLWKCKYSLYAIQHKTLQTLDWFQQNKLQIFVPADCNAEKLLDVILDFIYTWFSVRFICSWGKRRITWRIFTKSYRVCNLSK